MSNLHIVFPNVLQRTWQVVRNSPLIAISGVNMVVLAVSVFMSLLVVRVLPKEEYGHLVYFYAGFGMLRLLMNFGLGMNISRSIATSVYQPDRLRVIVYSTSVLSISATIIMLIGLMILAVLTKQPYMGYIAAAAIFASLSDLFFAMITGLRITLSIGLMTAIQPLSYMFLAVILIISGHILSEQFMLAYCVSFALSSALAFYLVLKSRTIPRFTRNSIQWRFALSIIGLAIPVYLTSLTAQGWISLSSGILGLHGQFQSSAEFGVAFNLITLVIGITSPTLVTTFFPQISHLYGQGNLSALIDYVRRTFTMLSYVFLFVGVALFSFSDTVISMLFRDAYQSSATYLTVLAPSIIFLGLTAIFTLTLVAVGRPWRAVIGLAVSLVILVAVIELGGNIDATHLSWAVLISSFAGLVAQVALASFTLKAVVFPAHLLQTIILALIAAIALRYMGSVIGIQLSIWHFILGGLFAVIYWLRVFRIGDFAWLTGTS